MITIQVILGSTRRNRFSEKPGKWIVEELKKQSDVAVELLDLRDWPLPFFDEPMPPSVNKGEYVHPEAKKWAEKIGEADAYIIVTPEYNRGPSAVLKNAIDHVYREWNNKPVAFVAYGSTGGARAVEQLRSNAIEVQMAPIREAVYIMEPRKYLDEQGNFQSEQFQAKAEAMIKQLLWWSKALKTAREVSKQ